MTVLSSHRQLPTRGYTLLFVRDCLRSRGSPLVIGGTPLLSSGGWRHATAKLRRVVGCERMISGEVAPICLGTVIHIAIKHWRKHLARTLGLEECCHFQNAELNIARTLDLGLPFKVKSMKRFKQQFKSIKQRKCWNTSRKCGLYCSLKIINYQFYGKDLPSNVHNEQCWFQLTNHEMWRDTKYPIGSPFQWGSEITAAHSLHQEYWGKLIRGCVIERSME